MVTLVANDCIGCKGLHWSAMVSGCIGCQLVVLLRWLAMVALLEQWLHWLFMVAMFSNVMVVLILNGCVVHWLFMVALFSNVALSMVVLIFNGCVGAQCFCLSMAV